MQIKKLITPIQKIKLLFEEESLQIIQHQCIETMVVLDNFLCKNKNKQKFIKLKNKAIKEQYTSSELLITKIDEKIATLDSEIEQYETALNTFNSTVNDIYKKFFDQETKLLIEELAITQTDLSIEDKKLLYMLCMIIDSSINARRKFSKGPVISLARNYLSLITHLRALFTELPSDTGDYVISCVIRSLFCFSQSMGYEVYDENQFYEFKSSEDFETFLQEGIKIFKKVSYFVQEDLRKLEKLKQTNQLSFEQINLINQIEQQQIRLNAKIAQNELLKEFTEVMWSSAFFLFSHDKEDNLGTFFLFAVPTDAKTSSFFYFNSISRSSTEEMIVQMQKGLKNSTPKIVDQGLEVISESQKVQTINQLENGETSDLLGDLANEESETKLKLSDESKEEDEYVETSAAQAEVAQMYNKLLIKTPEEQIANNSVLSTFKVGQKTIELLLSEVVDVSIRESDSRGNFRLRFETAASKGFVSKEGETGVKNLSEVGKLILAEVKVLGGMQNGRCKIGDQRIVCIWDTSTNIMYGFALQNHKEIKKTVREFEFDPQKMYQKYISDGFVNTIGKDRKSNTSIHYL